MEFQRPDFSFTYAGANLAKNVLCTSLLIAGYSWRGGAAATAALATTGLTYRLIGEPAYQKMDTSYHTDFDWAQDDAEFHGPDIRTGVALVKHLVDLGLWTLTTRALSSWPRIGNALFIPYALVRAADSTTIPMWYGDEPQKEYYEMCIGNIVENWSIKRSIANEED